ncbi:MAG: SDR family NAD(P)-dependent oxidoreductase [Candidatus Babeliales bacterium]
MQTKNYFFLFTLFSFIIQTNTAQPQKKAIVIGATSGIGKAIAQELVKNNYIVGVTGRRVGLLEELKQTSPDQIIIQEMDVEQVDLARMQLSNLITQLGTVNVFVFNSATWPKGPQDLTEDKEINWNCLQRMMDVNVAGFVGLTETILDQFRKQGYGHLVGISSVDAIRGCAAIPIYCACKSFMSIYLEGLRNKFIQTNTPINVTEIRPGWVQTSFEMGPEAYWVSTPEVIAPQIVESIHNNEKVAYVTRRWKLIGWLLTICPDWIYNKMGGF